jgi:hypothetical protein
MTHRVLRGLSLTKTLWAVFCMVAFVCAQAPVALAQHGGGGGHFGGGGGHFSAPPAAHAPGTVSRPHAAVAPPVGAFGAGNYRLRPRPLPPWRPIYPVYPIYGYPYSFYPYYGPGWGFGWGWGWGFNSCWWPNCDLFWNWGLAYNSQPFYQYGSGSYVPPTYDAPVYAYGDDRWDLPQLYLKDGSVLTVTDYWLVDNQLHFTMIEEGGTKPIEHEIPFDELDVQRTIDIAGRRGFRFALRNKPLEQYMQENPKQTSPPAAVIPNPKKD